MSVEFLRKLNVLAGLLPRTALPVPVDVPPLPAGATTELGRRLQTNPRPLIHPAARMIVIFSHKSACTNAVIWFLHHLGHAGAAMDYHLWPHEYREKVYYASRLYREAFALDLGNFTVVRIVRDPWERAVSAFRHVLEFDYADAAIDRLLRRRDVARNGLAFAEFLDLLERSDLANCDPHYALQRHPVEDLLPVHHLINVSTQDLFARLNEVEAALGLEPSDLARMDWVRRLRTHSHPRRSVTDIADIFAQRFRKDEARRGPWPPYAAFLTPEARTRIASLYRTDIKAYHFP